MAPQTLLVVTFLSVVLVFLRGGAVGAPPHPHQQSADTKIVHGSPTDISTAPYQVFLHAGENMFGGVIVNNRWILTAAHCTFRLLPEEITVRAGSKYSGHGGQEYLVDMVKNHQGFLHGVRYNDISAIRTSTPISFVGPVSWVKLPPPGLTPPLNTPLRITGWGRTQNGDTSTVLKAANVVVTDFEKCRKIFSDLQLDESFEICVYPGDGVDCGGDSGGPVMMGDVLVGLSHFGRKDAAGMCYISDGITVYTKVSAFRGWIKQVTGT